MREFLCKVFITGPFVRKPYALADIKKKRYGTLSFSTFKSFVHDAAFALTVNEWLWFFVLDLFFLCTCFVGLVKHI